MNADNQLGRATRNLVMLTGIGLIVVEAVKLVLGVLADQFLPESAMELYQAQNIVDLAAMVPLVVGLVLVGRGLGSRLWLAGSVLLGIRVLLGALGVALRLAGVQGEGAGWTVLQVAFYLAILAAWVVLGITLIVRRSDGGAGLGVTAGVLVLVSMCVFVYVTLTQFGLVPFDSYFFNLANGSYKASTLFLACFLLSMAVRPQGTPGEIGRRVLFRLGAVGAVLLTFAVGLIWNQAVGVRSSGDKVMFTFAGLAGLGLLGLGLGYLGQGLVQRRMSGTVAAVLTWLQLLIFIVALLEATSRTLIWILGFLTLATQITGGISFLQSRRLAAPKLAVATGVVLLVSAAVSLLLLVFLVDGRFNLPWTVRLVMMAVVMTGLLSAFTMASVHHLQAAGGPPRHGGM